MTHADDTITLHGGPVDGKVIPNPHSDEINVPSAWPADPLAHLNCQGITPAPTFHLHVYSGRTGIWLRGRTLSEQVTWNVRLFDGRLGRWLDRIDRRLTR